jgi:glycosyltransferase involved in cell wall biosynthesis
MKVCMLDPLFLPYFGGTEKHVYEVGRRLKKNYNYDISILTSRLPGTSQKELIDGMNIFRSDSIYLENLPSFLPPPYTIAPFHVFDLLNQEADIFHIHNRFWYYLGTMAAIKLRSKKLVITLHNAKPDGISFMTDKSAALYDFLWGYRIMEMADRIVAVSEWTKQVTVPKYLQHKCTVIHNGIDIEHFTPEKDGSKIREKFNVAGPLLISNGRLVPQKGFCYLMDAFARIRADFPDATLIVIGKGPLKSRLQEQCKSLGIEESVHFVTGIPEEELPLYYSAADLFIFPTLWEPCAIVLTEALSSGLPILTTDAGGNPELVTESCGRLVPTHDAQALHREAKLLLNDPSKLKSMGQASRERAVKCLSWSVVAKRMDELYQSLM